MTTDLGYGCETITFAKGGEDPQQYHSILTTGGC